MGLSWRTAACRNRLRPVPPRGRLAEMAVCKATESGHGYSLRGRSAPTRKVARHGDPTVVPSFDRRTRIASTSRLAIEARSSGSVRSPRNLPSIMNAGRGRNAAPNEKSRFAVVGFLFGNRSNPNDSSDRSFNSFQPLVFHARFVSFPHLPLPLPQSQNPSALRRSYSRAGIFQTPPFDLGRQSSIVPETCRMECPEGPCFFLNAHFLPGSW